MTAPTQNMPPQQQGPNQYGVPNMPPDPNDPNQQPGANQGQPDPNQQPQQDPSELRGNLLSESIQASAEIADTVHEDYARIGQDLDGWKENKKQQMFNEGNRLKDYFDSIENDPNVDQAHKDEIQKDLAKRFAEYSNFDQVDNREHVRTMLDERVDATRHEYAQQLADRRDSSMAIKSGRKKDVHGAKFEYDVAVAVRNNFVTEGMAAPDNASEADKELAALKRNMAKIELNLGKPGEDPETNQGEYFKLGRAERDARKLRSGRFEQNEQGQIVEKEVGKFGKIRNAIVDKWNKWTQESRSEKRSTRILARVKKAAALAVVGVAAGAAAGVTVGVAAGAATAAVAGRAAKATAGIKLNKQAETLQADAHFDKVAALLDKKREQYADALANNYNINGDGASVMLSETFSEGANKAHKKNFRSAALSGATVMLFGAGAGAVVHHAVGDFLGFGNDTVSAEDLPTNGTGGHMGGEGDGSGGSDTGETGGNGGNGDTGTPEDNGDTGSTEPEPTEPQPHPDHEPDQGGAETSEDDTNTDTGEEQDSTPGHDPDEKPAEQTPDEKAAAEEEARKAAEDAKQQQHEGEGTQAGPEQPAAGAEVTITPEQMDGKWVSQVYEDQLGDGGQAEMLSNAQDAIKAGELEQVSQPDGTYYYKLTEAGAAKLPGAGVGSSTTGDVMRILASHSDKFTVA